MKVALVAEWVDPWRGGAETSTYQFMQHVIEGGVDLHLFTRSRPSPTPRMQVHTISGAAMTRTRRSMTFSRRVEGLLREGDFEVIHAISPCRLADVYQPRGGTVAESIERNLAMRTGLARRTLKRWANRFNFKQRYMLGLERQIMHSGRGPVVAAISRYVAEQLKKHYALPDSRIRTIYNGVDPDGFSPAERARQRAAVRGEFGIGDDELLVLLIAHNFGLKGVGRWMEALAMLLKRGRRNIRSLVIGKGDSRRWHHLARRLGIAQNLSLTGPSDRVQAFRCAADVMVHPTYYDPCSRVVLESMTAGLATITTRWDGASEMIRDGVNGYVLPDPGDVCTLADRIERLCNARVRREMGLAAGQIAESVSMRRHADSFLSLYDEIAARCGAQVSRSSSEPGPFLWPRSSRRASR